MLGSSYERSVGMNTVRRIWLPVLCALLQALSVGTGAHRSDSGVASGLFTLLGVASGLALFGRHHAPFGTLSAVCTGYVLQVLVDGPALPVAVAVVTYVVAHAAMPSEAMSGRPVRWTVA